MQCGDFRDVDQGDQEKCSFDAADDPYPQVNRDIQAVIAPDNHLQPAAFRLAVPCTDDQPIAQGTTFLVKFFGNQGMQGAAGQLGYRPAEQPFRLPVDLENPSHAIDADQRVWRIVIKLFDIGEGCVQARVDTRRPDQQGDHAGSAQQNENDDEGSLLQDAHRVVERSRCFDFLLKAAVLINFLQHLQGCKRSGVVDANQFVQLSDAQRVEKFEGFVFPCEIIVNCQPNIIQQCLFLGGLEGGL